MSRKPTPLEEEYPGGITWVDREYDPRLGGAPSAADAPQPARQAARAAIEKAYPQGVPPSHEVPNQILCRRVREYLPKDYARLSDKTIRRAAGRS